ncbi:MAG TPA: hypothetical protein VMX55_06350 [candidate division Zixibacteria bacterium]|nr:hypothetical protein [candidate division Zixibacteria bacterium]
MLNIISIDGTLFSLTDPINDVHYYQDTTFISTGDFTNNNTSEASYKFSFLEIGISMSILLVILVKRRKPNH